MAGFADLGNQLKALYDNFTIGQKVSIVIMVVLLAVVFGSLIFWAGRPELHVLYSKLSPEDAQTVVSDIEGKVKYQLRDNGTTILVPKESLYKLRLDLAAKGLPKGGVIGFEIFDKTSFGVTDFAQRVNFKRAIEGELTRTIMQLNAVDSAKVMIAIPEKRLFESDKAEPTASIVLGVRTSAALSKSQVQGIVYLVASSVENLQPGYITVIDISGNILYKGMADSEAELASTQNDFKRNYETSLEEKIKAMVEKVVGVNKVVAMVTAEFDFSVVNKTEELFDPEKAVIVSEQRSTDTSDSKSASPSGVPGVRGNVPPTTATGGGEGGSTKSKKTTETINYEVSKVVKSTKEAVGELVKQSISLIVDGKYKEVADETATEGGDKNAAAKTKLEYIPRTDEELEKITALVKSAVGYNDARGDQIEIENMRFTKAEVDVAQAGVFTESGKGVWDYVSKYAPSVVMLILIFLFVLRPMMKWMTHIPKVALPEGEVAGAAGMGGEEALKRATRMAEDIESKMEREVHELEAEIAGESTMPEGAKRKQAIKGRLSRMADKDPESVSSLLKTWMHED